jgi:hypothetical protein
VVKKLDSHTYDWKFEATEVLSKETINDIFGPTIQGQGFGLRIFSVRITHPHDFVRFLDLVLHEEVPKLFSQ